MDMENLDLDPPLPVIESTELLIAIGPIVSAPTVTNLEEIVDVPTVAPSSALDPTLFSAMVVDSSISGPLVSNSIPESSALLKEGISDTERSRLEHDREAEWERRRLAIKAQKERKRLEKIERRRAREVEKEARKQGKEREKEVS
jgi:hypothetical protein